MTAILLGAVAAHIAAPLPAGASSDKSLVFTSQAKVVQLPFELRGNLIYLRGRVNDSELLSIVLDSGASSDAINESRARALGLEITGHEISHGAGEAVEGGEVQGAAVKLEGVTLEGTRLGTLPLDSFGAQTGREMDLILGHPLLSRCVVEIDYAAGILTIHDSDEFHYSARGTVLPLQFENNLPYVTARLTLPGRSPVEGRFVIDTGSGHPLILTAPFVREQRVLEAVPKTIQMRGHGVGGETQNVTGRIGGLDLGGIRIDQPTAVLRLSDVGVIAARGAIGNIGGEILRRFKVIFDYPRKRMILEPNEHITEPFEVDMSGLGLTLGPGGSHTFKVAWIQPASPAAEAGVQPEDLIESIDDRPCAEFGMPVLREMFRRPGETHRLGIRRGETQLEISITTRRMI